MNDLIYKYIYYLMTKCFVRKKALLKTISVPFYYLHSFLFDYFSLRTPQKISYLSISNSTEFLIFLISVIK